jgi:hypothetical protein
MRWVVESTIANREESQELMDDSLCGMDVEASPMGTRRDAGLQMMPNG